MTHRWAAMMRSPVTEFGEPVEALPASKPEGRTLTMTLEPNTSDG